LIRYLLLNQ